MSKYEGARSGLRKSEPPLSFAPDDRLTDFDEPEQIHEQINRPIIIRVDGADAGRVWSLDQTRFTIGRHRDNEVVLEDSGVSRHHATLEISGTRVEIIDQGALNGTVVGGRRQHSYRLISGDTIQLGPRVTLKFKLTDAKEEALMKSLYESSNHDALTGLYNRKYFNERLLAEIAAGMRKKGSTALVIFDIDHFKRINDTYGHDAGDAILSGLGHYLSPLIRIEDCLARLGGEEFGIVVRAGNLQEAQGLAERLRIAISQFKQAFNGHELRVSVSLGCAYFERFSRSMMASGANSQVPQTHADYRKTMLSPEERAAQILYQAADRKLYEAKHRGRNQVAC